MANLISENNILFDVEASNCEEAISIMAELMEKEGKITDKQGFISDVLEREAVASTAIGYYIATPHSKSDSVAEAAVAFLRLKNAIMWDDEELVRYVFIVGVPARDNGEQHLEILANLFRKISSEEFRTELSRVNTPKDLMELTGIR